MEAHRLKMWQKDGEFLEQPSIVIWNVSDLIVFCCMTEISKNRYSLRIIGENHNNLVNLILYKQIFKDDFLIGIRITNIIKPSPKERKNQIYMMSTHQELFPIK